MANPLVVTLGCRLNAFESEVMRREADVAGLDAVIVNTCAVTGEAVRQARQTIRKLRRQHPDRRIVVTGCAAQLAPRSFAEMPEVDRVLGNAEKLNPAHLAGQGEPVVVSDIMRVRQTAGHLLDGFEGRARAFVEVQQGCDHRCTFCIIPFARGPNRSVPEPLVTARVRQLVENGYREVVLTGVDICSWGADLPGRPGLGALVQAILAHVPELSRLRLSTLDPAAIDERLFRVLAEEPRLMPHLHLSLQAMDDLILKRMKRRHSRADALAIADRARSARPDVVFGADLIAGFPTESEAMFLNTLNAVEEIGLTYLHVFPYSPRPNTPAARMPQVPATARRQRAARLRMAGTRARHRFFAGRVGASTEVLVEGEAVGRCPWYAPVSLGASIAGGAEPGTLAPVRINAADEERLYAESVS
ncbi:MAG: tRNA (N(6)-L-threonylcarbamoyladenosine(37)-C(2))-methylthiotransferase MtaB [Allosphingosinicella sp.]